MPRKTSKAQGSLGKNLIRDRFKGRRNAKNEGAVNHTSELDEDTSDWARLAGVSVTEQTALDDFIATAELAGTDFTAERLNTTIVTSMQNEALPSKQQQAETEKAQRENRRKLRVPRRPEWSRDMLKEELHLKERESFLDWRRGLATLEETEHIIMTPFERNLDFWRQFWRVVERSDVVVQIVDARNPLLFRCPDVEEYVRELDPSKINLLLINKADLLTDQQRGEWAQYLAEQKLEFVFFSAAVESQRNDARGRWYMRQPYLPPKSSSSGTTTTAVGSSSSSGSGGGKDVKAAEGTREGEGTRKKQRQGRRVRGGRGGRTGNDFDAGLSDGAHSEDHADEDDDEGHDGAGHGTTKAVAEEERKPTAASDSKPREQGQDTISSNPQDRNYRELYDVERLLCLLRGLGRQAAPHKKEPTIGMIGYPNVGKSSTINAICRSKMVSVSATPGKTKHFQTISLGDLELCDCPGLVFPNFANTKAELVCNGVLPIDQLRDSIAPVTYVTLRIPRGVLESTYGISIIRPGDEEDPNRPPTAQEFLNAFSFARGFMNARGHPDVARGARFVLKDFVKGKLLYCEPPPGFKSAPGTNTFLSSGDDSEAKTRKPAKDMDASALSGPRHRPTYANEVDDDFFKQSDVKAVIKGVRTNSMQPFPDKKGSKKHHNKNKREKLRRVVKKK